ncbi:OmpH family outer membrane protein [Caulobacter sp. KR2-114]|uniref:OmpH family outer membrane protein n=1 Tax=Caulobacter sp. KR2-114 TaxID=3400912 RepID=UPI003BFC586A
MRSMISAALVLALAAPGLAVAQTASSPPLGGPLVPGVCLMSVAAVDANAKVGQAATARLQELQRAAQAEVNSETAALQADDKALQAQKASLKPSEFDAKARALRTRAAALQQKANLRSQQWELTRQKALQRIHGEMEQVVPAVYKAHGCGLLVDRNAVLGGNMGNDLTKSVVDALDARITTISFDLEPPPAPPAR